jgi:hypothetical protein
MARLETGGASVVTALLVAATMVAPSVEIPVGHIRRGEHDAVGGAAGAGSDDVDLGKLAARGKCGEQRRREAGLGDAEVERRFNGASCAEVGPKTVRLPVGSRRGAEDGSDDVWPSVENATVCLTPFQLAVKMPAIANSVVSHRRQARCCDTGLFRSSHFEQSCQSDGGTAGSLPVPAWDSPHFVSLSVLLSQLVLL